MMKSAVLARPNLKAFLLGAILIALVQDFLANGNSQATALHARGISGSRAGAEEDLQFLLQEVETSPSSRLYTQISRCYEKHGDFKRAILYLRKAQLCAQIEEADD